MIDLPSKEFEPIREEQDDDVSTLQKKDTTQVEGFKESLSIRLPSSLEINIHSSSSSLEHLVELGLFLINELKNDSNEPKSFSGIS